MDRPPTRIFDSIAQLASNLRAGPARPPEAGRTVQPRERPSAPPTLPAPARVLIVEDERITALNLEQRLTRFGYQVCGTVANGRAALAKAVTERPDIVLMDINIEGDMDGIETASHLRSSHGVPVIYLSAYSEDATLARARQTQAYGYLLKPFSERELHATLQMALERAQLERELERSKRQLELALDSAAFGTWEFDQGADRLHCDARSAAILGLRSGVSGDWDSLLERVQPNDRLRFKALLHEALQGSEAFSGEFRTQCGTRSFRIQGKAGGLAGATLQPRLIGLLFDLGETALASIQPTDAAAILEAAAEGVFVLGADHRLQSGNSAFYAMTQLHRANVVGMRFQEMGAGPLGMVLGAAVERHGTAPHGQSDLQTHGASGAPVKARLSLRSMPGNEGARIVGTLSHLPDAPDPPDVPGGDEAVADRSAQIVPIEEVPDAAIRQVRAGHDEGGRGERVSIDVSRMSPCKLDREFAKDLPGIPHRATKIAAVVALAHRFGLALAATAAFADWPVRPSGSAAARGFA